MGKLIFLMGMFFFSYIEFLNSLYITVTDIVFIPFLPELAQCFKIFILEFNTIYDLGMCICSLRYLLIFISVLHGHQYNLAIIVTLKYNLFIFGIPSIDTL